MYVDIRDVVVETQFQFLCVLSIILYHLYEMNHTAPIVVNSLPPLNRKVFLVILFSPVMFVFNRFL